MALDVLDEALRVVHANAGDFATRAGEDACLVVFFHERPVRRQRDTLDAIVRQSADCDGLLHLPRQGFGEVVFNVFHV